ncbi:MAG: hypothetical protein MZV65_13085 [Chromatiales bacterium]|nr:hypothetical protein [Chromatiales bacterium]
MAPLYAQVSRRWTCRAAGRRPAGDGASASACSSTTAPQCHGSDARGSKGFPNLTDSDWLCGGAPETIKADDHRRAASACMPPMAAAVGSAEDVHERRPLRAEPVGQPRTTRSRAAAARRSSRACAACHGPDGKGNPALGAPNLTDKIWLHGWRRGRRSSRSINNGTQQRDAGAGERLTTPSRSTCWRPTSGACRSTSSVATAPKRRASMSARLRGRARPRGRARHRPPPAQAPATAGADDAADGGRLALRRSRRRSTRARSAGWFAELALGAGLGHAARLLRPALARRGTTARRCCSTSAARRFYIFGLVLYPQDFIYLTALLIISALRAVPVHRGGRAAVVRLRLPADGLHRDLHVDRAAASRATASRACGSTPAPWSVEQALRARRPSTAAWIALALWTGFTFVGYFTPIRDAGAEVARARARPVGDRSGCCSTASPPTATPAACASRSASTCARTRASRARCSTRTR